MFADVMVKNVRCGRCSDSCSRHLDNRWRSLCSLDDRCRLGLRRHDVRTSRKPLHVHVSGHPTISRRQPPITGLSATPVAASALPPAGPAPSWPAGPAVAAVAVGRPAQPASVAGCRPAQSPSPRQLRPPGDLPRSKIHEYTGHRLAGGGCR